MASPASSAQLGRSADLDANKAIVERLFAAFSERRFVDAGELMTPDATWWMLSHRRDVPVASWLGGYERQTATLFPDGLRFELVTLTAEDDRVAVQARCFGVTDSGAEYKNDYHFLFEFTAGRIAKAWEYGDTLHAQQIFG
jgi:hypothetical protein